jgi:mRNA-degrading endonuclease RelE of RelBE toxin-antitoxin system
MKEFDIVYAPETRAHMKAIAAKHHRVIREAIEEQLTLTPEVRTRSRKPLKSLPGPLSSTWELRCGVHGKFRVFYEIRFDIHAVHVLAIGLKERDRLYFAGEEFVP